MWGMHATSMTGDWVSSLREAIPVRKQRATIQRPKKARAANRDATVAVSNTDAGPT